MWLPVPADGEGVTTLIWRNATAPTKQTHAFTTHSDNQPGFLTLVCEDGRAVWEDNLLSNGIPPASGMSPRWK